MRWPWEKWPWSCSPSQGYAVLGGNQKCVSQDRGELTYRDMFLPQVPTQSILMPIRTPHPQSLIGPQSTFLIGWNGATLVIEDANEDITAEL